MKILDVEQGSLAWHAARCGSLGASAIADATARTRTGWGATRASLMARLVVERLTGQPQETYQTPAMLHGIETEPEARIAYEFHADCDVQQVGLVLHPEIAGTHASPDGLVGDKGLIEVKCPQPAQHLATLLGEPIPEKYVKQMLWQMRCCEREWCDFVSYSPAFPEPMRLFVKRAHRDDKAILEMETMVRDFLDEVEKKVAALAKLYPLPEAA